MTKSEPVALDLGASEAHRSLVRTPIPSVDGGASAAARAMLRSKSPAPDHVFRNDSSPLTRPGVSRHPWMAGRVQADPGMEDNPGIPVDSFLKREVTEAPSTSAFNRAAPRGSSLNRHEDSALAQQYRKAAFMYGTPLQALRSNIARMASSGDEAQLDHAHQSGTDQPSSSHSAGMTSGVPVPQHSRMKGYSGFENGVQSPLPQQQQRPIQGGSVVAAHAPGAAGKLPGTAQLTIFYAGMVNVYDDIPFDKAQAIMLLAGTGNAWSSNCTNLLGSSGLNPGRPFSVPGGMQQPMSRSGSPAPQLASPSAGSPVRAAAKLLTRQVTAAVELPQARKASLARFLEKRKDRVRKGPYTHPSEDAARNDALRTNGRENSPNNPHSSGKPPRRSLSPAGNEANNNSGEPSSQPQTPPQQITPEDKSLGMLGRKECENLNVDGMVVCGAKSSPSR